jgi:hypothetical protein
MSAKCSSVPPSVLSMVLADQVYRDPASGKFSILGTYCVVRSPRFPCLFPRVNLYAAVTESRGRTPLRVVLTDVDEEQPPLAVAQGELQTNDPTQLVEVSVVLQNVVFPGPGDYRVQLFSGPDLLRELRLRVAPAEARAAAPENAGDRGGLR